MKLLVMSDSHRNIDRMEQAANQVSPDAIVHLGDHISDALFLQQQLFGIPFYMVVGNCDPLATGKKELFLTLEGVNIYMTHGHMHGVKRGIDGFIMSARAKGADLALFGHTHNHLLQKADGLWLMNPGQMQRHDYFHAASYGVVTIEGANLKCEIVDFQDSSLAT